MLRFHDEFCAADDEDLGPWLSEAFTLVTTLHQTIAQNTRAQEADWLQRAYHELKRNEMTLPEVARRCGMATSTLRARFHAETGQSPVQWRIAHRMQEAQNQLLQNVSITKIAHNLGYPTVQAFSRQFSKEFGIPPATWRSNS